MTVALAARGEVRGVRWVTLGQRGPVTVFAHGLGGSTAETRPLASRVEGTRVLLDFRGHGASDDLENGWDYDLLADDLLDVADATGASRAVGVSLGSGALLRALTRDPDRFAKVAFLLPAAVDRHHDDGATLRLELLGAALGRGDREAATELLLAELPPHVRDVRGVRALLSRRAAGLLDRPAPWPSRADLPLVDRSEARGFSAPALVVSQAGDVVHRADLARELAHELPDARLVELPAGGVFWTALDRVRDELAHHLREAP